MAHEDLYLKFSSREEALAALNVTISRRVKTAESEAKEVQTVVPIFKQVMHVGEIVDTPAVTEGWRVVQPATFKDGYHVNIRLHDNEAGLRSRVEQWVIQDPETPVIAFD